MSGIRLFAAVALIAASAATGCTSSGGGNGSTQPPASSSGSITSGGSCTKASAKSARQTLISSAGFSPACVRIAMKSKFFFVNNEKKRHTATTKPGAPTHFDAELRTKGSTYEQAFKKRGTYVIVDKTTKDTMTLYVG
jgi:plastocyanin